MKYYLLIFVLVNVSCSKEKISKVPQWTTHEIRLLAQSIYDNPYVDITLSMLFVNSRGDTLTRPGFWDGEDTWKVRFAPPDSNESWNWLSIASNPLDKGLHHQSGRFESIPYSGNHDLTKNGLLKMSPGKRNVVHYSSKSFLVVGDTPWALPFRATTDQAVHYARDRQSKGFNTALLMTVQPDMEVDGPNERDTILGFKRGFDDLFKGHINELNPDYFQYLDSLIDVLLRHEIVPAYQPVFHGFGWKGLKVLGNHIVPQEYVRYCRYLLARYGSMPAMWLIAGDNGGRDPGVKEAGAMLENEDCYHQPVGLHYNPCDDYIAEWAIGNPLKHCEHYNNSYQAESWLDFQWAQTGHSNEHLYHKVERMYNNLPTKASANGEPTYEGMNDGKNGLGWWQGEEAWMQWMSGGTMGVVYGAAGLWQWKVAADEPGWNNWASQAKSWKQAMQMEGSTYVGMLGKILDGLEVADIEKRWDLVEDRPLLAKKGKLYIAYLNEGGALTLPEEVIGMQQEWINPKSGERPFGSVSTKSNIFKAPDDQPWVLILKNIKK